MSKDKSEKPFTGVYLELSQQANLEHIRDLLRVAQDHSGEAKRDINLPNVKKDAINMLRRAIAKGYLEMQAADDLLRDSEECGQQVIYLYRPKDSKIASTLSEYGEIASRLFDDAWGRDFFPIHVRNDNQTRWVDCRQIVGGGWLLKAYGHETIRKTIDTSEVWLDEHTIRMTRDLETETVNTVFVVRWRPPDLLEVRIDKTRAGNNKRIVPERLEKVAHLLRPAVNLTTEMVGYSLQVNIASILANRNDQDMENPTYRVGHLAVLDKKEGRIEFTPFDNGDLDDDDGRSVTVETSISNGAVPLGIHVKWLRTIDTHKSMPSELLTKIQGRSINAVNISKRISPQALDYVINQLRSHS